MVRSNSANAWRASKYMSIGKVICEGNRYIIAKIRHEELTITELPE